MTSWHLIKCEADECRLKRYALCVEMNGSITCRMLPSTALVEEKFLWAFIGGALVNKKSGKVLEACVDVGRPPTLGNASTPLRKTQIWKFEMNKILHSKNDRALILSARSADGTYPVLGCPYPLPSAGPIGRASWRLISIQESNVLRVDMRSTPVSIPPQKIQEQMPDSPVFDRVPKSDDINIRDLLFQEEFCRDKNAEYRDLSSRQLLDEWNRNGISGGHWGSPIFDVKYYLDHHEELRKRIPANDFQAAAEYFVHHCEDPVQTSELFDWRIYNKMPDLVHYTPSQLFWHYYHIGSKQHIRAV